jgi:hypothetical protein
MPRRYIVALSKRKNLTSKKTRNTAPSDGGKRGSDDKGGLGGGNVVGK